jgi:nitronate monooxygenase
MLVSSTLDDIVLSRALTGLETNLLRPSVEAAGMDTTAVGALDADAGTSVSGNAPRRWKDVWSAGHTVSQVHDIPDAATLIDRIVLEYATGG